MAERYNTYWKGRGKYQMLQKELLASSLRVVADDLKVEAAAKQKEDDAKKKRAKEIFYGDDDDDSSEPPPPPPPPPYDDDDNDEQENGTLERILSSKESVVDERTDDGFDKKGVLVEKTVLGDRRYTRHLVVVEKGVETRAGDGGEQQPYHRELSRDEISTSHHYLLSFVWDIYTLYHESADKQDNDDNNGDNDAKETTVAEKLKQDNGKKIAASKGDRDGSDDDGGKKPNGTIVVGKRLDVTNKDHVERVMAYLHDHILLGHERYVKLYAGEETWAKWLSYLVHFAAQNQLRQTDSAARPDRFFMIDGRKIDAYLREAEAILERQYATDRASITPQQFGDIVESVVDATLAHVYMVDHGAAYVAALETFVEHAQHLVPSVGDDEITNGLRETIHLEVARSCLQHTLFAVESAKAMRKMIGEQYAANAAAAASKSSAKKKKKSRKKVVESSSSSSSASKSGLLQQVAGLLRGGAKSTSADKK